LSADSARVSVTCAETRSARAGRAGAAAAVAVAVAVAGGGVSAGFAGAAGSAGFGDGGAAVRGAAFEPEQALMHAITTMASPRAMARTYTASCSGGRSVP
jgi:hypothetical protein